MAKVVLGLDMDGVLYAWHDAIYTLYSYEFGYTGSYHDFWSIYVNSQPKETQDFMVSIPMAYNSISPAEHVVKFLDEVSTKAELFYITNRPKSVQKITENYLKNYNFPFHENLCVTRDKATACRYYGITHFIDDHVRNIKEVSPVTTAYLLAKMWNIEYQEVLPTVYSLNEFKEKVFD